MPDEYIKRSDALKAIRYENRREENRIPSIEGLHLTKYQLLAEAINNIPAADVAEVRHGYWVYKMREHIRYEDVTGTDPLGGTQTVTVKTHVRGPVPYCSLCDALAADSFLDFCPRCGAKMDGPEGGENADQ